MVHKTTSFSCVKQKSWVENDSLMYSDILFAVKDKLEDLINDYLEDNQYQDDISNLINDYLQINTNVYNIDSAISAIMDSPQMAAYLDSKKVDISIINSETFTPTKLQNKSSSPKNISIMQEIYFQLDCGLQGFLQVLSQIER